MKSEYRSKNCVLFENVFFVIHVINRRRAPITKSPIFFLFRSTLSIYIYLSQMQFSDYVTSVQLAISKNLPNKHHPHVAIALKCTSDMYVDVCKTFPSWEKLQNFSNFSTNGIFKCQKNTVTDILSLFGSANCINASHARRLFLKHSNIHGSMLQK